MEWTSVDYTLPECEVDVLVFMPNGMPPRVAGYFAHDGIEEGWYTFERPENKIFPTHWMPLPNPPKD